MTKGELSTHENICSVQAQVWCRVERKILQLSSRVREMLQGQKENKCSSSSKLISCNPIGLNHLPSCKEMPNIYHSQQGLTLLIKHDNKLANSDYEAIREQWMSIFTYQIFFFKLFLKKRFKSYSTSAQLVLAGPSEGFCAIFLLISERQSCLLPGVQLYKKLPGTASIRYFA